MTARTMAAALALALVAPGLFTACHITPEEAARNRFRNLRMTADNGTATDQIELAKMYRRGEGVPQSNTQALHWYKKAAANGHPFAQASLAVFYFAGEMGVPRNRAKGAHWLRQATERQHTDPEFLQLPPGTRSQIHRLIERIQAQAAPDLQRQPAAGRPATPPQDDPPRRRIRPLGPTGPLSQTPAPPPEAIRQAAAAESPAEQTRLGRLHAAGTGVPRDINQAATWFKKAAMQGYAPAQFHLGSLFAASADPSNRVQAYAWLTLAAETAQRQPATRYPGYSLASFTRARDELAAKMHPFEIPLARSTAAQFRTMIQAGLGLRDRRHVYGHPQTLSLRDLEQAARQGEPAAAYTLAHRYAYGGHPETAPDFIKAYTWALVSLHRGNNQAGDLLQWLTSQMPAYDRTQARQMAERIQPGAALQ